MKRIVAAVAVLLFAAPVLAEEPAAVFKAKCAGCHGEDGKGKTKMGEKMGVPDLTQSKASAADFEKAIADGKGKMMPYKGKIPDADIKAVATYVKSLK